MTIGETSWRGTKTRVASVLPSRLKSHQGWTSPFAFLCPRSNSRTNEDSVCLGVWLVKLLKLVFADRGPQVWGRDGLKPLEEKIFKPVFSTCWIHFQLELHFHSWRPWSNRNLRLPLTRSSTAIVQRSSFTIECFDQLCIHCIALTHPLQVHVKIFGSYF